MERSVWDRVNKKIANNPGKSPQSISSPHLLGGIIRCGKCGYAMSASYSGSKNNRYRIYRCSANKNKGTCISKQYKAELVEQWLKKGLYDLYKSGSRTILLEIKG